jgi:hypothetical protein
MLSRLFTAVVHLVPALLVFLLCAGARGGAELPPEVARPPYDNPAGNPQASSLQGEGAASTENVFLWEGFESEPAAGGWSVDDAADPAVLFHDGALATQGLWSMRMEADFNAKGRTLVRRVSRLKFQGLRALLVDVHSSHEDVCLSFAYKDTGGGWHESPVRRLAKGWNRDLVCSIAELKTTVVRAPYYGAADESDEFYLVIHRGAARAAVVNVDNLRFEGEPTEDWHRTAPRSIELYQPVRGVGRYEKFEVGIQFEGTWGNLFDPADVLVEAVLTDPEGELHTVRGFAAGYADSASFGAGWPIFLVRFAPQRIGRWTYYVRARNREGEAVSCKQWFYVTDSKSRGFVRVSPTDSRCFEYSSGDLCYPIGQNVAWTQDYEPYLRRQKETGQNWVRIWLCPWNIQLETAPAEYDLDAAARLDRIVQCAEENGVCIQLVLNYHGMVSGESWAKNPYNSANGGPCHLPSQFFSNERARELFKRRLDYIAARWGYSTSIFAWELFNEVDIGEYATFDDVVQWHREMSDYLRKVDPGKHLITTSLHRDGGRSEIWNLPGIDFVQAHLYDPDIEKKLLELHFATRDLKKPVFVGEYGRGGSPTDAQRDPEGRDLQRALWGSFMLPFAGSAMPWWWDSYIRPRKLEYVFAPLSRYAQGVERRAQNFRVVETAILRDDGAEIAVRGLLNNHSCYLWLHRPQGKNAPPPDAVLVPRGQKVALSGMLGGKYRVEIMETTSGRVLQTSVLTCEQGKLTIEMPQSRDSLAVKVQYQGTPTPQFFTSPEMMKLEEAEGRSGTRPPAVFQRE